MSTQARMPRCAVAFFFLFLFFAAVSLVLARRAGRTTRVERYGKARND
jgi:hypothetical protein